ncbi:Tail-specific protease precursor [Labilithrix luteola]|uniref:Tail-specific protease n=1 Tax=Labilithrix luteola TaxID=1391654 RepID=A0A0K1QF96_9BACT|nr:S41 family peptidase [Labilithrix luteola]AKV04434.1 Tail-specific protease precursor [Labilithrix luteola]
MRRSFIFLALLVSCHSPQATDAGSTSPVAASSNRDGGRPVDVALPEAPRDAREPVLASAATQLLQQHVLGTPIDDRLSKEAFQRMIDGLDTGKVFLLESDVQKLARFETDMDDELRAGDLVAGRKATALLASRRRVVGDIIAGILAKPLDFTVNESIETDPKKRAFCKTDEELTTRWRGVLKLQALERMQELEDILEKRAQPKAKEKAADPDDAKRDAAAEKALGEIPTTFEGRRDKVQKELATRFATQFTRLATVDKLQSAETFLNAVNGAFDPHTNYLPPAEEAELDIALTGRLEGIGATLREQEHYILVNDLVPGGAAWQQGKLEVGDLIMAVTQEGKEPVDVMDMPIGKVVSMIRGPKGTVVILTVKKSDGSVKTISITRDVVRIEETYARGAILKTKGGGEVGYVHLPGFYGESRKPGERNATDDMRAILNQMTKKGVTSLVFDLRGDGGGLLGHARDIAGLFVKEGPIVQTKNGDGKVQVLRDTDPSVAFNGNVVVLVDRFCASAAEIVAGALQDYERAVVVGTSSTHGKGTVQAVVDLDREAQAKGGDPLGLYKVTIEEYFRVSGGSTQLKGVVPDILLPDPTSFIDSFERTLPHAIPWSTIKAAPSRRCRTRGRCPTSRP